MSLNIIMEKVDPKVVAKYLAHYKLKVSGALNAQVNAIEKHTRENVHKDDMSSACTVCGGESDFNLPECPYCGAVETTTDAPSTPADNSAASSEPPSEAPAEAVAEPVDPPAGKQKPKQKMGRPKPVKKGKESGNGHDPGPAIVKEHKAELVESKALDDAVVRVHEAMRSGASSYWELGTALYDIFDRGLWKQRVVAGKQAYTSWAVFCRSELNMSHVNTFSVMDAARAFSKKDFEDIGHRKLSMMLRLPKERQQLLLEEAKEGRLPRSRLKEIIEGEVPRGQIRETGRKKPKGTAKAAEVKRAARKAPTPDGEITAVSQLGKTRLKLWARPSSKKPNAKPVRAVSVTHDPWAEEKLVNGVVVRYLVVKTQTGLELIIERRRAD